MTLFETVGSLVVFFMAFIGLATCIYVLVLGSQQLRKVVRYRENILRGESIMAKNARKTHCKHGHPLSGDNLQTPKSKSQKTLRVCKTCRANRSKEKNQRRLIERHQQGKRINKRQGIEEPEDLK